MELLARSRQALLTGKPVFDNATAALPVFRLIPLPGAPGVAVQLARVLGTVTRDRCGGVIPTRENMLRNVKV